MIHPEIDGDVIAAISTKVFPRVDVMLREGYHLSQDGSRDEFNYVAVHRDGLYSWYQRYGYSLIYNEHHYAYLEPQGSEARSKPLSVYDMIAGQALYVLYLDPAGLQSDGSYKISDFHNAVQRILGDEGLEKLLQGKRKLPKERVISKARDEFNKAIGRLKRLGFISTASNSDYIYINRAIGRFGEMVSGLESEPEEAIAEMVRQGRVMWLVPGGNGVESAKDDDDDEEGTDEE